MRFEHTVKNVPAPADKSPHKGYSCSGGMVVSHRLSMIADDRRCENGGEAVAEWRPGIEFPEDDFSTAAGRRAEYLRICRRGYARMKQRRVVIAGLCRDVEPILPATILRIGRLASLFADSRIVVYENDSQDGTKLLLRQWALRDRRVTAVTENIGQPVNPVRRCVARASRMAEYRERCQRMILERHRNFDAVILLDTDLVGGWSEDGVANTFGRDEWDVVGANGLVYRREGVAVNELRQYDTWAYRRHESLQPLESAVVATIVPQRGEPLVRVGSCFGGLAIYRMEAFAAGSYGGGDCEHVAFHHSLAQRGLSRIFMNPSQLTLYGRRHRSTDRAVRAILRAWSTLSGSPMQPWLCSKGCFPATPSGQWTGPGLAFESVFDRARQGRTAG